MLTLVDRANDLKQLPRMGWLLSGVDPAESVAEHSYGVALWTLLLAESINADWQLEGLTEAIDVERALRLALLHDLAESFLTDLPKRSAELLGADIKHAAESQAMDELMRDLPWGHEHLQLWQEYDAAATPVARLVKDADKLEMVHQAWRYQQRGHANLDEFWEGHRWYYVASRHLFAQLQDRCK